MVDSIAMKYGLFINAAKTEIMVVGRPMTLPTFKLSGKELLVTDTFKYRRGTGKWGLEELGTAKSGVYYERDSHDCGRPRPTIIEKSHRLGMARNRPGAPPRAAHPYKLPGPELCSASSASCKQAASC
eukprot:354078-Chlamydomonas_euryale.AAC.4